MDQSMNMGQGVRMGLGVSMGQGVRIGLGVSMSQGVGMGFKVVKLLWTAIEDGGGVAVLDSV